MLFVAEKATCSAFSPDREGAMGNSRGVYSKQYYGPTLEDCTRLWDTIKKDLMTDAAIGIALPTVVEPRFRPQLIVTSPGFDLESGSVVMRTWSATVLQDGFEAITYRQLFDCLMVAYQSMDGYLKGQLPLPLP